MNPIIVALPLALLAIAAPVAPPQSMSLAGTWKTTEVTLTGPGGGTLTNVSSLTLLTAKHFARVEVRTDAPRPIRVTNAGVWRPDNIVQRSSDYFVAGTRTKSPWFKRMYVNWLASRPVRA